MSSNNKVPAVLIGVTGAVILMWGIACYADDQGSRNCRDNSIVPTTGAAKPGKTSHRKGTKPKPHSVRLSWHASANAVEGYNIYRREEGKGTKYKQINRALVSGTSCTDYDVIAGHTYFYEAKAVRRTAVSQASNEAKATVPHP